MKLSTAFKNISGLELVVNFYNLNEGRTKIFATIGEFEKSIADEACEESKIEVVKILLMTNLSIEEIAEMSI